MNATLSGRPILAALSEILAAKCSFGSEVWLKFALVHFDGALFRGHRHHAAAPAWLYLSNAIAPLTLLRREASGGVTAGGIYLALDSLD